MKHQEISFRASERLLALANSYIAGDLSVEAALAATFNDELAANGFERISDIEVEPESIEHGIVDIFANEGEDIIRIDPGDGSVATIV